MHGSVFAATSAVRLAEGRLREALAAASARSKAGRHLASDLKTSSRGTATGSKRRSPSVTSTLPSGCSGSWKRLRSACGLPTSQRSRSGSVRASRATRPRRIACSRPPPPASLRSTSRSRKRSSGSSTPSGWVGSAGPTRPISCSPRARETFERLRATPWLERATAASTVARLVANSARMPSGAGSTVVRPWPSQPRSSTSAPSAAPRRAAGSAAARAAARSGRWSRRRRRRAAQTRCGARPAAARRRRRRGVRAHPDRRAGARPRARRRPRAGVARARRRRAGRRQVDAAPHRARRDLARPARAARHRRGVGRAGQAARRRGSAAATASRSSPRPSSTRSARRSSASDPAVCVIDSVQTLYVAGDRLGAGLGRRRCARRRRGCCASRRRAASRRSSSAT